MVKPLENGASLPPFLVKCYDMVSDESTNELISWTESNDSFIIPDESKFSAQLLPKHFKHSNFSSFIRQLNIYGFRKIDTDQWQFANEAFIKDQKHLLKYIKRRNNLRNTQNPPQPKDNDALSLFEEHKISKLLAEVDNLKTDKNALMQELKRLKQDQKTSRSKMHLVRQHMKHMEMKQQQMLSFIATAKRSPEFMVQSFHPKENTRCTEEMGKDSNLSDITDDCESVIRDEAIIKYEPKMEGENHSVDECLGETSDCEGLMELDFSSDETRDLLVDINYLMGLEEERPVSLEDHSGIVLPNMPQNNVTPEQLPLPTNPATDDK